jgi:hypothetical protein
VSHDGRRETGDLTFGQRLRIRRERAGKTRAVAVNRFVAGPCGWV